MFLKRSLYRLPANLGSPNVILSPHCAAASDNDIINTCRFLKENLKRYLEGQELLSQVNKNQDY